MIITSIVIEYTATDDAADDNELTHELRERLFVKGKVTDTYKHLKSVEGLSAQIKISANREALDHVGTLPELRTLSHVCSALYRP